MALIKMVGTLCLFVSLVTGNSFEVVPNMPPGQTQSGTCFQPADCPPTMTCVHGICSCPFEFQAYENWECKSVAGGACDDSTPCISGASCTLTNGRSRRCHCDSDTVFDYAQGACLKLVGGRCEINADCAPNRGLQCINNACECMPSSYGIPGPCYKSYGDTCQNDGECQMGITPGLICSKSVCTCRFGQDFNAEYDPNPVGTTPGSSDVLAPKGRCEIPIGGWCHLVTGTCADDFCGPQNTCECRSLAIYNAASNRCECIANAFYNQTRNCNCFQGGDVTNGCKCPGGFYPEAATLSCVPV